jgi:allophanate hydrolase
MAAASRAAFAAAVARLEAVGGVRMEVDFSPFAEAAALLYQSSFVAERYSGIRAFLDKLAPSGCGDRAAAAAAAAAQRQAPEAALAQQRALGSDDRLLPVTRAIIAGAGACACVAAGLSERVPVLCDHQPALAVWLSPRPPPP